MARSNAESVHRIFFNLTDKNVLQVLHVDDEKNFLEVAKQLLEMNGNFNVETSTCADEAIEKIRQKTFDVVISDYQMPEKDGLEFLKELRQSGNKVPFIMFTGKGREEVAIKAVNLGADQYINKFGDPETVYGELTHAIIKAVRARQEERSLHESEDKYRTLVEQSLQGVVAIQDFRIVFANQAFSDISGYTIQELLSLTPNEVKQMIHPDDQSLVWGRFKDRLAEREVPSRYEYRGVRKDGEIRWLEMFATRVTYEGKPAIQGTIIDITERKKAKDSLAESEDKYRNMVELAPDGVVTMNSKGVVTSVNRAFLNLTRYSKEEIVGKHFTRIKTIRKRDMPKYIKMFGSVVKGKIPSPVEFQYVRKDKTTGWGEAHVGLLRKNGNITGVQAVLRDITDRKRVEESLRRSEEKFRLAFENANDAIFWADPDTGIIINCNRAAETLIGRSKAEIIGTHQTSLHPPEKAKAYVKMFKKHIEQKGAVDEEADVITKSGRIKHVHITASVTRLTGKPVIQGIFRDVTTRRLAEQKTQKKQMTFVELFRNNPEAAVHVDLDFRIVDINPRFEELFGYSLDKIKGKYINDVVVPKERITEAEMLDKKAAKGYVYHDTVRKTKDGSLISVSLSAAPITVDGQLVGHVALYKDITDRKRAEQELLEAREHFEILFDLMVDPVAVVDNKGKILEVTKKVEEITGFKKEELIGKNFLRVPIVTAKSKAVMLKNLAKRMIGTELAPYEIEVLTKGGRKLPYEINAGKIEYRGRPADIVVFRDVSERKKMEEKLRVVGGLTRHDVRNKLSTVTGNAFLIKRELSNPDKILEYLKDVESACEQITRIFEFARNYERLGIEELVYVDVGKTVEEASSLLSDLKGAKVVNDCHGLKLLADSLLRQIFYNLIDNSLKYGGKTNKIRIFSEMGKAELRLVYQDDGVGIPKTEKEKIFQEGYGKGTGYGLYLIRKICEVYGWSIQETGRWNKGAQFTMTIPAMNPKGKENYRRK